MLLLGLPGIIVAGAATTVVVGLLTAEHWTVVDVPEHKETFRTEEYLTGAYIVENLGGNPCYVGQDWYECRNKMVDEYNRECAARSLTESSRLLCDDYGAELDRMEEVGDYGWVVETLGSYGYLRSTQESSTRQVSNNDYRPAITHEATCYLGFLGECPG
ncbi:hypothetical protein ACFVSU_16735 [Microbacterium sp. NPDC058062]|uniref:hypothetical protein n=1 Tax=Microbacterium sp. NPDC058062 TaxID=3346320 RepID=UPI0036DF4C97